MQSNAFKITLNANIMLPIKLNFQEQTKNIYTTMIKVDPKDNYGEGLVLHVVCALVVSSVLAFFPILRMTSKIYVDHGKKSYHNELLGPSLLHLDEGLQEFLRQAGKKDLSAF